MIQKIIQDPTPPLRTRSAEVSPSQIRSSPIQKIIRDLIDTLKKSEDGIGIAAPQIAQGIRIFVISEEAKFIGKDHDTKKKDWKNLVYINPIVTKKSRRMEDGVEGCLSVPNKFGVVPRHEKLSVEAYDEAGQKISHGASKFFARVLQHELDHLDGILFIDKVKRFVSIPESSDGHL